MADPKGMTEIEDVLSSIRRLVASDTRTGSGAPAEPAPLAATPADRLVLTPALRIDDPETRLDLPEADAEEAESAEALPDPLRAWDEDSRADRAALPVAPEPQGDLPAETDDLEQTLAALEAELAGDGAAGLGNGNLAEPGPGYDAELAEPFAGLAAPGAETAAFAVDETGPEAEPEPEEGAMAAQAQAPARAKRSGFIWEGAFEEVQPEADPIPTGFSGLDAPPEDEPLPEAGWDQADEVADDGPGTEVPEDTFAAVEDLAEQPVSLPEEPLPEPVEDADAPAWTPFAEPAPRDEAQARHDLAADPSDDGEDLSGPGLFDADAEFPFDEAHLREIVAEIIRDELRGALGDRLSRNLRKLVRQELRRELAALGLDPEN